MFNSDNCFVFSCSRDAPGTFEEKTKLKIILQNYKHWYLIHTWSDKALIGILVSRAVSSLHISERALWVNR